MDAFTGGRPRPASAHVSRAPCPQRVGDRRALRRARNRGGCAARPAPASGLCLGSDAPHILEGRRRRADVQEHLIWYELHRPQGANRGREVRSRRAVLGDRRKCTEPNPRETRAVARVACGACARHRILSTDACLDTLQNEYVLRPEIHRFFVDKPEIALPELNGRVYSEVFKTPSDDPWLGLRSDETFTALAGEGVEQRRDTLRGR